MPDTDIQLWEAARATWEREVRIEASRAKAASFALVAMAVLFGVKLVGTVVPVPFGSPPVVEIGVLVATAVLFLRWLAQAVTLPAVMGSAPLRWTSSGAVWSFFLPIFGLWRPFYVVRELYDHFTPNGVPEPAPKPRLDGSGGYRHVEMVSAPPPRAIVNASIGAWWGFFVAARLIGDGSGALLYPALSDTLSIISAVLAVLVVRSIDGRIAERFRRLAHASDDELAAWQIRVA